MASIKSIETSGWRGLKDGLTKFGEGLNFVRAPNEGGKTSCDDSVVACLYGDGAITSEKFHLRNRRWNHDGDFFVRVTLEHEGEDYELTRDFGEKTNTLLLPDGTVVRDKRKIAARVQELMGLPTAGAFQATACIPQEEMALVCGEKSILELCLKQITGSKADTDVLLKKLERQASTYVNKSGKRGELVDLQEEIEHLEVEFTEQESRLKSLVDSKRELASAEAQLSAELLELDSDEAAYAGFRRYNDAQESKKLADFEFECAEEALELYRENRRDIARFKTELREANKKAAALQGEIEKAEKAEQAERELQGLQGEANRLKKKLAALDKLTKRAEELDKKLEKVTAVSHGDLKKARNLASKAEGLESAITQTAIGVEVKTEGSTRFSLEADGTSVRGNTAKAHVEATVTFPGEGTVHVSNLTGGKEPLVQQLERARSSEEALLGKYGVTDVEGLEKLCSHCEALEEKRQRLEERKAGLLGGEEPEELQAASRDLKGELSKAERARDRYRASSLSSDVVKFNKRELKAIQDEGRRIEKASNECKGAIKVLGSDEKVLQKDKRVAAKRLAVAEEALRENAPFACSAAEFARRERVLQNRRQKVESLKAKMIVLETRIEAESIGQEDVSETAERISQKKAAIERFVEEHEIIVTIVNNILRAREKAVGSLSKGMAKRMGAVLSEITEKRYEDTRVDGNLNISVFSQEKGDYIDLGNGDESLSTGARDAMYLAARLALLEALTGDSTTPLIFDDSFSNFDPERQVRAFKMLESMAEHRQVVYLTCHHIPSCINRRDVLLVGGKSRSSN